LTSVANHPVEAANVEAAEIIQACANWRIILGFQRSPILMTANKTEFSTPDLSDDSPEAKAIPLPFNNYGQNAQFSGPAVTIKCHEDNSLVKQLVDEAGEGRVIVVDGGGSRRRALLGDMLAEKASENGWSGLVINGVIRDVDEIGRTDLGVQALGTIPVKTEKLGAGQRDIPIEIEGVSIEPGDFIYADNNGVLVSKKPLL
jgi:regulator of ribonuclease activity A